MRSFAPFIFIVAMIVGVIAILVYADGDNKRKAQYCEDHGGTWFYHEQKCVQVRNIPMPE